MSNRPFHIVDVFAREKYTGNQLAVITDAHDLPVDVMQRIAQEMNFSETSFISGSEATETGYSVRIFTPETELPFAGHPTLGTAFVLREHVVDHSPSEIVLDLEVGSIPVTVETDESGHEHYWMEQNPPTFEETPYRERVADVVGLDSTVLDPTFDPQIVSTGLPTLVVPVDSIDAVREASIDESPYKTLVDEFDTKGVFVFSSETVDPNNDIHARDFAPALGVPEDPATGSSNGCLAAYLVEHEYFGQDGIDLTVEQGYEMGRPSRLHLRASKTDGEIEVSVGGRVVPVSTGELL